MLTQEQAVEVRVLARRGGKVKQIARELGVLAQHGASGICAIRERRRYGPRQPRPTKLDPFQEYLQSSDRGGAAALDSGDGVAARDCGSAAMRAGSAS